MNRLQSSMIAMVAACLAAAAALSGCGPRFPDQTGTVSGKLTYQGQPVPPGTRVVFLHRGTGRVGTGFTDPSGAFQLSMQGVPRVLVGEYAVGIAPPLHPDAWKMSPEEYGQLYDRMLNAPYREWKEIPRKYQTPETSGETFTVQKGANEYTLDMRVDWRSTTKGC